MRYFDRFKRDVHGKSVVNDQAKRGIKVRKNSEDNVAPLVIKFDSISAPKIAHLKQSS
jgi:hypothetical protein